MNIKVKENIMKLNKINIIVFFVYLGCTYFYASAQSPWLDENYRSSNFPSDTYYSSYFYKYDDYNDKNKTIESALKEVQGLLANSISSKVTSNSRSSVNSINNNNGYYESEEFYNDVIIAAQANLINIHLDYYYDETSKIVHTFAYMKKSDLSSYLHGQISSNLTLLGEKIKGINELISQGYKIEAKNRFEELPPVLNSLVYTLENLITVEPSSAQIGNFSKQIEEYSNLIKKYETDLSHNISIFIKSDLNTPFKIQNFIPDKCMGQLSAHGYNFVSGPDNADYIVYINCETRSSSISESTCYAFADVDISITRCRDNNTLYQDSFSVKGGALSEEKAHRRALQDAPETISNAILTVISK